MRYEIAATLVIAGILTFAVAASAGDETYTYDAHGRLTSVVYSDGSSVTYTYDDAGNRMTLSQTATP